ncbi:MAG: response regulator [Thermoproteota archaeon]|nr:response regulator [Thermoproteota archaeon]
MTTDKEKNNKKNILIVDDETDVCLTLKVVLEGNGFKVYTFVDPTLELENFKSSRYDLLILDIKMPVMNGFQLYAQMKKIDLNIKALFLSALTDLQEYDAFKKEVFPTEGRRQFIQKPIENEEMLVRINVATLNIEYLARYARGIPSSLAYETELVKVFLILLLENTQYVLTTIDCILISRRNQLEQRYFYKDSFVRGFKYSLRRKQTIVP